ncbi:MAG: peptidylprolyl isomerase [Pseudohongiellaceae bacterium]
MPDANNSDRPVIAPGSRVTLHFSLALADGSLIDSNFDKPPATFVMGDGSLLPGFEGALLNHAAGAKISVLLPAEQSFGASNPENVQVLPRRKFAALLANSTDPVQEGTVLSFTDTGGFEIPGVVKSIDEDTLVVDFNHPLAGREILFTAEIHAVIPVGVQVVEIK